MILRNLLFSKIMRLEISSFDKRTPGELGSIATTNLDKYKSGINFKFADAIILISRSIGCLILAISNAWKFALVLIGIIVLIAIIMGRMNKVQKKYTIIECTAFERAASIAQEVISSIRTVLSFWNTN